MAVSFLIKTENLSFIYDNGREVLKNINLHIKKGEYVAILGHNGSGKSTLARHFNGLFIPHKGKVEIDGMDTSLYDNIIKIRQIVGMVFQNPDNQIVAAVVEEDVAFGPENLGIDPPEIRKRVNESLKKVGMEAYIKNAPHMLSGGQKQKIAIAGVLAMKPKCIVLDEPTAMLDPKGRRDLMQVLKELHNDGITVVQITHNMDEAIRAERIIVMNEGEIFADTPPEELFKDMKKLKSLGLEPPQITKLMMNLGIRPALTMEEAYDTIVKLKEEVKIQKL